MNEHLGTTVKFFGLLTLLGLLSACGTTGTPQQIAEANAVHAFDEDRAPYGLRIARAQARYKPRLYGLNPYFGR